MGNKVIKINDRKELRNRIKALISAKKTKDQKVRRRTRNFYKSYYDAVRPYNYFEPDFSQQEPYRPFLVGEFNKGWGKYISEEDFHYLMKLRDPKSHKRVREIPRNRNIHAVSFVFGVPADVSTLALVAMDERIPKMLNNISERFVKKLEGEVCCRVRKNNSDEIRKTGNFSSIVTTHRVGYYGNPSLHIHVIIPNFTYDTVEDEVKAVEYGFIMKDLKNWNNLFMDMVYEGMLELGYKVHRAGGSISLSDRPEGNLPSICRDDIPEAFIGLSDGTKGIGYRPRRFYSLNMRKKLPPKLTFHEENRILNVLRNKFQEKGLLDAYYKIVEDSINNTPDEIARRKILAL